MKPAKKTAKSKKTAAKGSQVKTIDQYCVEELFRRYSATKNADPGWFITVEGNIAVGKSEFCSMLARFWENRRKRQVQVHFEPVDDPTFKVFLDRFQKDQKRWATTFQMFALKERFRQHTLAAEQAINGHWVIQDRSIYADCCFGLTARELGNIDDHEWEVYEDTFGHMKRDLRYPDLMIFLDVPPKICVQRATGRGREEELDTITLDYFTRIHNKHQELAKTMTNFTRVLHVPYKNFAQGRIGKISDAVDKALLTPSKCFTRDWVKL
jgi:deoxyadenosine/deoxycytidine kinase